MSKSKKNADQITDELLYIIKTVNETVTRPKDVLGQLGIIVFPHSVALCRDTLCKMMALTKSSFATKLQKAECSADVLFPTYVKDELRKLVGEDFKKWSLRSTPVGSAFRRYVEANPSLVVTNRILTSLCESIVQFPSCPSSPQHTAMHEDMFNLAEPIPV